MNCINCNKSVQEANLYRTNPKDQKDAGWMCEKCITEKHDTSVIPKDVKELADTIKGQ